MQVVCGNCQLSFDAPDGATGLVCPICRGPLRAQAAEGSAAAKTGQDWSGGDLDDLIAILSAPAVSARVEVLPPNGDTAAGEVHLLAGGVSDALFGGQSIDDALDKLRAIKQARFRVEPRLPNPADGDLANPGPESGTLESRALAHLMRYCEDYVITCSIDVWRGNENARVEYKRGEISGVTVGGIDAPERLAEVMQWSSGNYRLVVPPLKLPAQAPKRAQPTGGTPAPVPAPAPSAQAARQASATKTMFGIPIAEVTKAREAAAAAKAAHTPTPAPAAPAPAAMAKTLLATPSPAPTKAAPVAATSITPGPVAVQPGAATKTIFGVPAPSAPEGYVTGGTEAPRAPKTTPASARTVGGSAPAEKEAPSTTARAEADRKTGARKVSVPAPDVGPAPVAAAPAPAPVAVTRPETTEPVKRAPAAAPAAVTRNETTEPVKRAPATAEIEKPRAGAPVLSWALVGVFFGAVFLAVYYFVGQLGH